jgi:hypothetical protein
VCDRDRLELGTLFAAFFTSETSGFAVGTSNLTQGIFRYNGDALSPLPPAEALVPMQLTRMSGSIEDGEAAILTAGGANILSHFGPTE